MKGYCCLGWIEIPAETHGAAKSTVVPQSGGIFSGDKVSYAHYLPWPFYLLTKNLYSDFYVLTSPDVSLLPEVASLHIKDLCRYHFACHTFTFCLHLNYMHSDTAVTSTELELMLRKLTSHKLPTRNSTFSPL